jgi:mRNA-degrading endonuclease YafQ of YafQ-DinJ toxin-antitoxin module
MNLELASSFVRAYKGVVKRDSQKAKVIQDKIEQFRLNPKHPLLRVHKLGGFATETWSFSVGFDLRILFTRDDDTVLLVGIGTHNQVY